MAKGKYKKSIKKGSKKYKKGGNKKPKISGSRILYGAKKWQYVIIKISKIILIILFMKIKKMVFRIKHTMNV